MTGAPHGQLGNTKAGNAKVGNGKAGNGKAGNGRQGWRDRLARLVRRRRHADTELREQIEALIEQRAEGTGSGEAEPAPLSTHERLILSNVLHLRGTTAADAMVPRADIVALPLDTGLADALSFVAREGHSRYPVYREALDDVVGMVHIKDLYGWVGREADFSLSAIVRRLLFVAPATPVLELLLDMRLKRTHLALVVDEFGGIDGLLTIEDVVEEIVGDIADEHDEQGAPPFVERADGSFDVDARLPLEDFEAKLGQVLTEAERAADVETVGGLVLHAAGRIPGRGETIVHASGLAFRVTDSDSRRIRRVRVTRPAPPAEAAVSAA
ncbi:MAG: HlyC/CorC family transporter [Acetobacteraceae bacterium]|nr:HlyC/CorC family transporter [Acetobacteraceae bacterium]